MEPILEMNHITKSFPGVMALDDVTVRIMPGEIHSIVGENGAGKSTLMKILSGVYQKDSGEILFNKNPIHIKDPQSAIDIGIGTVYQNLDLIPALTVAENIFMNQFKKKRGVLIDWNYIETKTQLILDSLNCHVSPNAVVDTLSVADQQMVAIARVLSRNITILILDEPTSSLNPVEAQRLFDNVHRLKKMGVATIFISHHMNEILSISEHVTVLCDGKLVGNWPTKELDEQSLIKKMIGREVIDTFPKIPSVIGEEVLRAEHISVGKYVQDISFTLRKGEILGISGLVGAGRTWLVKSIFGAVKGRTGDLFIESQKVAIKHPKDAKKHGLAFVSEDRRDEGLIGSMSIKENVGLCNLKDITKYGFIKTSKEAVLASRVIKTMGVKTPSSDQLVENLSGGNQQKVVLGKWFMVNPKVMIFDEPTRGIDVGAKSEIHKQIGTLAAQGMGILVISSELPELIGICDRIFVMSKGKKTAEFERKDFNAEEIMFAAAEGV